MSEININIRYQTDLNNNEFKSDVELHVKRALNYLT